MQIPQAGNEIWMVHHIAFVLQALSREVILGAQNTTKNSPLPNFDFFKKKFSYTLHNEGFLSTLLDANPIAWMSSSKKALKPRVLYHG